MASSTTSGDTGTIKGCRDDRSGDGDRNLDADHAADHAALRDARVKPKATRRKSKRDGLVQFQFVTATDPLQFKSEDAKRSVRSQAMTHYRNKPNKEKKTPKEPNVDTSKAVGYHKEEQPYFDFLAKTLRAEDPRGDQGNGAALSNNFAITSRSLPATTLIRQVSSNILGNVSKYEYTEDTVEVQLRMMVAKITTFFRIADGVDPFVVLPQFESPELNIVSLKRTSKYTYSHLTVLLLDNSFRYARIRDRDNRRQVASSAAFSSAPPPQQHRPGIHLARYGFKIIRGQQTDYFAQSRNHPYDQ
jgi:hypothetical protein